MINLMRVLKSFKYALSGLIYAFKEEQNFRVHTVAAIVSIVLGFVLKISFFEWIAIVICISLVLMAELINTIFERIVDILKPRLHPYAEKIKDMMAGIVVVAAALSLVLALLIFLPKILAFFQYFDIIEKIMF